MSRKAVDKIADGLKEAIAFARGELKPTKVYVPAEVDVRSIRNALGHSQGDFASAYGFTLSQIRQWEQERCQPTGALRAYLTLIQRDPVGVAKTLQTAPARRATTRRAS
jgi:putative transcriptional regulator